MIRIYVNGEYYAKAETFEEAMKFANALDIDDIVLFCSDEEEN